MENKMDLTRLNPVVRSASVWETVNRTDECTGYDCRLIYIITGDMSITAGGEKFTHNSPGSLVFIPAGTPYKMKSKYLRAAVITFDLTDICPEPADRIPPSPTADFDADKCHNKDIGMPFDKVIKLEDFESERETFERMCNIFTSAEGEYRATVSAMLKLELLKISENVVEDALPARMVEELDAYIRDNCSDEISNTEIGAIFGYHPFYVSRILKERKGLTLRQYIINYRIKASRRMLEVTSKTVSEIAEQTGFTDASYFTKIFKNAVGMTPKEYRNQFKDDFI